MARFLSKYSATDHAMAEAGIAALPSRMRSKWEEKVNDAMTAATLTIPDSKFSHKGGRTGARHTEHLGHMLATMQVLQRSHPGAAW